MKSLAIIIMLSVIAMGIGGCIKPDEAQVLRAEAVIGQLKTVKPGDLLEVRGQWQIVHSLSGEEILTFTIPDNRGNWCSMRDLSWVVTEIVRTESPLYDKTCSRIVRGMVPK